MRSAYVLTWFNCRAGAPFRTFTCTAEVHSFPVLCMCVGGNIWISRIWLEAFPGNWIWLDTPLFAHQVDELAHIFCISPSPHLQ